MKIAFILVKGLPMGGGIEKYTDELGSRLAARGHQVTVYALRHYGAKDGIYNGMTIHTVPTLRKRSLEKLLGTFSATLRFCLSDTADIVHMHAFGPAMWGVLPRLRGCKVVTQGHGLEWKRSKWSLFGRIFLKATERPSVWCAHRLTAVSQVQRDYLQRTYNRDCTVIPTGINPPNLLAPNLITSDYGLQGNDYILFAARLVQEKGAHYLIDAYRSLARRQNKKLVIAGDAQYEEAYKAELRRLAGDDPDILFTGFVTGAKLDELFSNAAIFVLPSEIEGLPTVLLEAMSYGNCCLVSDIPENQEALSGHGTTFASEDVASLREQLQYLLDHPQEAAERRESARSHVLQHYNWDDIADRFEAFYTNVLQE